MRDRIGVERKGTIGDSIMARKWRKDLLEIVQGRYDTALQYQTRLLEIPSDFEYSGFTNLAERWIALVTGQFWVQVLAEQRDRSRIRRGSNQIAPKLQARHAIVTMGETEFFCEDTLERFAKDKIADKAGPLLNTEWSQGGFDIATKRCDWDAPIYGFGVVELRWDVVQEGVSVDPSKAEPRPPPSAMPIIQTQDGLVAPPEQVQEYESSAAAVDALGYEERQDTLAQEDMMWNLTTDDPVVERFCPLHLLVDPYATCWDLSDARYVFRVRFEYLDRVKSNSRYLPVKQNLTGGLYDPHQAVGLKNVTDWTKAKSSRNDLALVQLLDGYMWLDADGDGKEEFMHIVIAEDNILLCEECVYDFWKWSRNPYPFRVLPGTVLNNDTFYCASAVEQACHLQISYDEAWSQAQSIRKRLARIWMYPEGAKISPQAAASIENPRDGEMVGLPQAVIESLKAFPEVNLPIEIMETLKDAPEEIGRQLGISQFDESMMPQKKMLKAEIDALRSQGSTRVKMAQDNYNRFVEDVGMCVLALIQQFGVRHRSYATVSPDGAKNWGSINAEGLRGFKPQTDKNGDKVMEDVGIQFRVKVNASNSEPSNKDKDRDLKLGFLKVLEGFAQMPDPQDPRRPLVSIKPALKMAADAFDVPDAESMIAPTLSPEEEQQVKVEIAQMQAQVAQSQMPPSPPGGPPPQVMPQ